MTLRGKYDEGITYDPGDVVLFEQDDNVYHLQREAPAGTEPIDTRYWGRVNQLLEEAVRLMLDAADLAVAKSEAEAETLVGSIVAPEYTEDEYSKGDIRMHDGVLYKAAEDIAEAEEWTEEHWTEITVGTELKALNAGMDVVNGVVFDDSTLVLVGSDEQKYAVTVDDSGDTPALDVSAITEESEEEET